MMHLDDSTLEVPLSGWKPEFLWIPPDSFQSSLEGTTGCLGVSCQHDYSHLVGDPAKRYDSGPDSGLLDELLTEDDQILLHFGMRVVW